MYSKITKIVILVAIGSLTGFAISCYAALLPPEDAQVVKQPEIEAVVADVQPVVADTKPVKEYFVQEKDGGIAVYSSGDKQTPLETRDVLVDFLPDQDKEMLFRGVTVIGDENLAHFLEDFAP